MHLPGSCRRPRRPLPSPGSSTQPGSWRSGPAPSSTTTPSMTCCYSTSLRRSGSCAKPSLLWARVASSCRSALSSRNALPRAWRPTAQRRPDSPRSIRLRHPSCAGAGSGCSTCAHRTPRPGWRTDRSRAARRDSPRASTPPTWLGGSCGPSLMTSETCPRAHSDGGAAGWPQAGSSVNSLRH